MKNLSNLRREYSLSELKLNDLNPNPYEQFNIWFENALNKNVQDASAFVLSTIDDYGYPSSRIILLKGILNGGFEAYTNLESRKSWEIKQNPKASLLFYWKELEQQIRMKCDVTKISDEDATTYFNSRPRESQITAWVSNQSKKIENKQFLKDTYNNFASKFKGKKIPKPSNWGGYKFIPFSFIFWQGGEKRLHDVFEYTLKGQQWDINRVAP